MQVAAIYARYSTDGQRETSIDDQVRRCREVAEKSGYTVDEALIFTDAALTGTEKAIHKRTGYHAMLAAWDQHRFNALVVDEIPRLARDAVESAELLKRIEVSGVRLLSPDGTDTLIPNWQLQFQIVAALGEHFIRETRHRVLRGMIGQLERGYMIAAPAFGYDMNQVLDENGESVGTHWTINPEQAEIVRKMYAMRRDGVAFAEIAKFLNQSGVKPPRKSRKTGGDGYWRQSSVYRMLCNTIYRGAFVWNGSAFSRGRAKKEGRTLEPIEYQRQHLRLVDDETWNICNEGKVSRTARGGGKHAFSGLVSCGTCDATLTVSTASKGVRTLYCPQCLLAKRVAARDTGPGSTSTSGFEALMKHLLERLLHGEVLEELRNRLRQRLEGGSDAELQELRNKVVAAEKQEVREVVVDGTDLVEHPVIRVHDVQRRFLLAREPDAVVDGDDLVAPAVDDRGRAHGRTRTEFLVAGHVQRRRQQEHAARLQQRRTGHRHPATHARADQHQRAAQVLAEGEQPGDAGLGIVDAAVVHRLDVESLFTRDLRHRGDLAAPGLAVLAV